MNVNPYAAMSAVASSLDKVRNFDMDSKQAAVAALPKLERLQGQAADGVADLIKAQAAATDVFSARNFGVAKNSALEGIQILGDSIDLVRGGTTSMAIVRQQLDGAIAAFEEASDAYTFE